MPNLNGTGPEGKGQLTGWGRGSCNGNAKRDPIGASRGFGRRFANKSKKEEDK